MRVIRLGLGFRVRVRVRVRLVRLFRMRKEWGAKAQVFGKRLLKVRRLSDIRG